MKKYIIFILVIAVIITAFGVGVYINNKTHSRVPQPISKPDISKPYIDEVFNRMSLRDKVASLFIFHSPGTDVNALRQFADTYHPGGMILMGDNIPSADVDLRAITSNLRGTDDRLPRLVAIDQEGGTVKRIKSDAFPSAETLKQQYYTQTYDAFEKRSRLVQSMGVTLNFGIVADVTNDPNAFIYNRVLGTNPQTASDNVKAAVNASHDLTLSTLKHFPGHGETVADSHTTIPTTDIAQNLWEQRDAPPFKAGIQAGVDMIMLGHLRYSVVDTQPASLSKKWHDILRNNLEFSGITITDDMCMLQASNETVFHDPVANAVTALQAGNTLLLYVLNNNGSVASQIDPNILIDGVLAAVNSGKVDRSLIESNVKQVLKVRAQTSSFVQK